MTHEIKANTILEYEYLCGLIYLSRRDWSKALGAFERAVTHPSKDKGVSKIQTDAYRKWLLVGLLANGRAPTLPSYTSSSAKAAFANLAAPYNSIAQLFSTPEAAQLKTEAESNSSVWEEDGNQSLVNEVLSSYQKWQIVYLRSIYNQLSVSTILECTASAETGGPLTSNDEIVRLIEGMFESGMLKGQLHVDSGVTYLQFHTEVEAVSEAAFSQELIQAKESIMVVTKEYNAANAALGSHPEYVKHVAREQRRFEKEADDPMEHFESQIEEEDLMADVVATG